VFEYYSIIGAFHFLGGKHPINYTRTLLKQIAYTAALWTRIYLYYTLYNEQRNTCLWNYKHLYRNTTNYFM